MNWESIVGRDIQSDILDAYRPEGEAGAPEPLPRPSVAAEGKSFACRLVHPAYQRLLADSAKVGLILEVMARRPPGDDP